MLFRGQLGKKGPGGNQGAAWQTPGEGLSAETPAPAGAAGAFEEQPGGHWGWSRESQEHARPGAQTGGQNRDLLILRGEPSGIVRVLETGFIFKNVFLLRNVCYI